MSWQPSRPWLALALGLVLAWAVWGLWPEPPPLPEPGPAQPAPPSQARAPGASAPRARPSSAAGADADADADAVATETAPAYDPQDLAQHVPKGQVPTMNEVIARLHRAGVRSGLGAFQPPGISPPLVGLAVPEDFPLPAGYVRHYQTTDDGQDIEPILMFSPDRPWLDANGRPIEIPADRVVPPELAPPGLPLRRVLIPPPLPPASAPQAPSP